MPDRPEVRMGAALAMIFKPAEAAEKAGVASMATTSCRKLSSV
jgi:hypothetical protein